MPAPHRQAVITGSRPLALRTASPHPPVWLQVNFDLRLAAALQQAHLVVNKPYESLHPI